MTEGYGKLYEHTKKIIMSKKEKYEEIDIQKVILEWESSPTQMMLCEFIKSKGYKLIKEK